MAGGHAEVATSVWGMLSFPRASPAACTVSSQGGPLPKEQSHECVSSGANSANPGEKALEDQALGRMCRHNYLWAFVVVFSHVYGVLVLVFSPRVLVC